MTRAALYARLSQASEDSNSIETQLANARAWALKQGYEVVEEFHDDGISGYSGKRRPGFSRLIAAVVAGRVDVVMARHQDRFARNDNDLWALKIACSDNNVKWQFTGQDVTDPQSASGGLTTSMQGAIASYESHLKTERLTDHYAKRRAEGTAYPARTPFGYNPDKRTPHPTQGPAVQWAFRTILKGGSMYEIKKAWNTPGPTYQAPNGTAKEWGNTSLRHLLRRPYYAGLVVYKEQVVEGVRGKWEPLVSEEDWRTVQAIMDDPNRRTSPGPKQAHLMGGIALCGVCMGVLRSATKGDKGTTSVVYRCTATDRSAGPHASMTKAMLEPLVVDAVAASFLFGAGDMPEDDEVDLTPLVTELARIRERKAGVRRFMLSGLLSEAEAVADLTELRTQEQAAEDALRAAREASAGATVSAGALDYMVNGRADFGAAANAKALLKARFLELPIESQRELVRARLGVVVHKGSGPKRVQIHHLRTTSLNDYDFEDELDPDPSEPYKSGEDTATEQS